MKRKVISLFLCFSIVFLILSVTFTGFIAKGEVTCVYLSSSGDDQNDGLTTETPLKTLVAAINKVNDLGLIGENRVVTITKSDWNDFSFNMSSCLSYDEMITLNAVNDYTTVWANSDMHLAGPLKLNMTYGKSVSQTGLNIYTHGYDFELGEKANEKYQTTSIYAGFDKDMDPIIKDSNGIIDFDKDINISITTKNEFDVSLYIGNYAYNDVGIVQYQNVNVLIDSPNVTIPIFKIGNNGNYSVGIAKRMNRFEDFSLTVNAVAGINSITSDTYYNGCIINNLQFIYNNATLSKVADNLEFGDYGDTGITYMNKWVLNEENDFSDSFLKVMDEIGKYTAKGIKNAVITDSNGNVYKSVNGKIKLEAGEYIVSYENASDYHYADGVLTAMEDLTDLDVTDIAPTQVGNMILNGWQMEDGKYLKDTAHVTLSLNQKLFAIYSEFDVTNDNTSADFYVDSGEYQSNSEDGIYFVVNKGENFKSALKKFSNVEYGYLVLPKHYIDLGEKLSVDNNNAIKGNCNKGFFYLNNKKNSYSVYLTDIKENHYDEKYNTCGYVTYTDLNNNKRTVYSNTISCSLLETAANAIVENEKLTVQQKETAQRYVTNGLLTAKEKLKKDINENTDTVGKNVTGTVYYVSENGSDNNDGLSEDTPWKTLEKVNKASLEAGDVVLFERGGTYRSYRFKKNALTSWSEHDSIDLVDGVSYGAYGNGSKPVINGSDKNYANLDWKPYTSKQNVYYLQLYYYIDPAVMRIAIDNDFFDGVVQGSINDLDKDWEFSYDRSSGTLYMYSAGGNPKDIASDIEIGFGVSMFKLDNISNVTIENLSFKYIGRHAIASFEDSSDITVRGCEFNYIGGCLPSPSDDAASSERLGNAIEFLSGGRNVLVENCSFDNIFDSGVTFQGGANGVMNVENFVVRNNIFNKCGLGSFEYWLGALGIAKNIHIENNYMENAGIGIGGVDIRLGANTEKNGHIRADGFNRTSNFIIRNNYFDNSADKAYLLVLKCETKDGGSFPDFDNNTFIQIKNQKFMLANNGSGDAEYIFDDDVSQFAKDNIDKNAVIIYK